MSGKHARRTTIRREERRSWGSKPGWFVTFATFDQPSEKWVPTFEAAIAAACRFEHLKMPVRWALKWEGAEAAPPMIAPTADAARLFQPGGRTVSAPVAMRWSAEL